MNDSRCPMFPRLSTSPASGLRVFLSLVLPVLVLGLGSVSCRALTKKHPVARVVEAKNERVLWNALRVAIHEENFQVGRSGADEGARTIKSAWKLDLAPFRGRGSRKKRANRSRVLVSYNRFDGNLDGADKTLTVPTELDPDLEAFAVTIRVESETNESLRPMDVRYAKWTPADDEPDVPKKLFLKIAGLLGTTKFKMKEDSESPFSLE